MVRPCIDVDFNVSQLGNGVDCEVKMFCATLAGNRAACEQLRQVHRQNEASLPEANAIRENLARLFGACCRRGSAEGF
eukprot:10328095-Karenia_brevis.AAC.1